MQDKNTLNKLDKLVNLKKENRHTTLNPLCTASAIAFLTDDDSTAMSIPAKTERPPNKIFIKKLLKPF